MERLPDHIRDAAYGWRALLADGPLPAEAQAKFDAWLASDPRHAAALARAEALWRELGSLDRADLDAAWIDEPAPQVRVAPARPRRRSATRFGLVPSLALVGTLFAAVFWWASPAERGLGWPWSGSPRTLSTAHAEVTTTALSDGTRVTLGGASELEIAFDRQHRRLRLLSGEAYFEVAHDADRPFEVTAGATQARALGTAFEMRRRGERTVVAVAEGIVGVGDGQSSLDRGVRLNPGQRVIVSDRRGAGDLAHVRVESVGAWRRGRLVFTNATLADVVADASRYHDRPVVLADPDLGALQVTASFRAEDIDALLAGLTEMFPVRIDRSGDATRILARD
ncbi:MAG: FecR domain-containing protein [Myxococcota bacterium]